MLEIEVFFGFEDEVVFDYYYLIKFLEDDFFVEVNLEDGSEVSYCCYFFSCVIVCEMQQFIIVWFEVLEKCEEVFNICVEFIMEFLWQYMEWMEWMGFFGDDVWQWQLQMIEGVDNKFDRFVNGFGILNKNIGVIIGRFMFV